MRKTLLSQNKGFTLLEVVFAVGILAIGMLGYTSLKISNRYSWVFAKDLSQAVQVTGANLERFWLAGYHEAVWMSAGVHSITVNADGTHTLVNAAKDASVVVPVDAEPEVTAGGSPNASDPVNRGFTATNVTWTVRNGCPSELAKMVTYTTNWNVGGNKSMNVTQVQVRP